MAYVTFSQSVINLRTMADAITNRLTDLAGIGITAADATELDTFADELEVLNSEQEELKALLKTKTDELNAKSKEAKLKHSDLTKRIKIATPKQHWLAFGITAKK